MTRLLAVADEVDRELYDPQIKELDVDLVVSCGDLPFDYLEFILTTLSVPLIFVPGNHDPELRGRPLDGDIIGLTKTGSGSPGLEGRCATAGGRTSTRSVRCARVPSAWSYGAAGNAPRPAAELTS